MHKKNRGEIDMKILRIDRQGALNGAVYKNLEDLRESLIDYHSMDYDDHFDEDEEYKPIEKFTLDEILIPIIFIIEKIIIHNADIAVLL